MSAPAAGQPPKARKLPHVFFVPPSASMRSRLIPVAAHQSLTASVSASVSPSLRPTPANQSFASGSACASCKPCAVLSPPSENSSVPAREVAYARSPPPRTRMWSALSSEAGRALVTCFQWTQQELRKRRQAKQHEQEHSGCQQPQGSAASFSQECGKGSYGQPQRPGGRPGQVPQQIVHPMP